MLRAFRYYLQKGELPETQRQGTIICIPKQGKIRNLLKNWRPITLLNTTYKLFSAILAERFKIVVPSITKDDQKGFVAGEYIGENIRHTFDLILECEKKTISIVYLC